MRHKEERGARLQLYMYMLWVYCLTCDDVSKLVPCTDRLRRRRSWSDRQLAEREMAERERDRDDRDDRDDREADRRAERRDGPPERRRGQDDERRGGGYDDRRYDDRRYDDRRYDDRYDERRELCPRPSKTRAELCCRPLTRTPRECRRF